MRKPADHRPRSAPPPVFALAVLAVALPLASCASRSAGPGATPGRKVVRMSRNFVGGYRPFTGSLELNVEKTVRGDSARYELMVRWIGEVRVNIREGESLIMRADGEELRFSAPASQVFRDLRCDGRCTYDDRAYYPATAGQIRKIAAASRVIVRAIGSSRTIEREFNDTNFERFQEFVARHLPGAPS